MHQLNRRRLLTGTAVAGGFAAGLGAAGLGTAAFADPAADCTTPAVRVGKEDPRYRHLVGRGKNERFTGSPDHVHIVTTTDQVVAAVTEAVAADRKIAVRSGGHCFEDFVDSSDVKAVIDMSMMNDLCFDAERRAFAIEPGLLLAEVYRWLYLGWGVTIPAGSCLDVGVGGHILGGGYGTMAREHGLVVDHLYAVEVVVVNADGTAEAVVATRDADDPNRDLWWAHTGGGGGNFGVVTRYWLRSPDAEGDDPAQLLPRPPREQLSFAAIWDWSQLDRPSYERLVRNHGDWHAANSEPGTTFARLHTALMLNDPGTAPVMAIGTVGGDDRLDEYLAALTDGMSVEPLVTRSRQPWLDSMMGMKLGEGEEPSRAKVKAGYLRRRWSDEQIALTYETLNGDPASKDSGMSLWLVSYGGKVNEVKPSATATAQRDSVLKAIYMVNWTDPDADAANLARLRGLYADVYAAGGGVPAPDEDNDGSFINYVDADLADEELNTSGVAWHTLYYKDNYPRLRKVKAKWDPRDVFSHKLGIRPPD